MYQLWAWWIHTDYLAGDQVCKLAHSLFEFVQDGQWFRSCCRFCCRFCCNIDSLLTLRIYRAANELHTAEHIDVTRKQHAKVFQVHVIRETVLGSLLLPFHLWAAVGVEVEMLEVAFCWDSKGISFKLTNWGGAYYTWNELYHWDYTLVKE